MGKRGRPKTPTVVLEARGSKYALDRKDEPKPVSGKPKCPAWLNAEAKKHWQLVAKQTDAMGVLSTIDGDALAAYCDMWSRFVECAEFLNKMQSAGKPTMESVDQAGNVKYTSWPQTREYKELIPHLLKYQVQFGLTPSARASLNVVKNRSPKEAKSEIDPTKHFKLA